MPASRSPTTAMGTSCQGTSRRQLGYSMSTWPAMAELSIIIAAAALLFSVWNGYRNFQLNRRQTELGELGLTLGERQTELAERQTELAENQAAADRARERKRSLPAFEILPGAIANEADGGASWTVRVHNSGSVEGRAVQILAT